MSCTNLPRQILEFQLTSPTLSDVTPSRWKLLDNLHFLSIEQLLTNLKARNPGGTPSNLLLNINQYVSLAKECSKYTIRFYNLPLGSLSNTSTQH